MSDYASSFAQAADFFDKIARTERERDRYRTALELILGRHPEESWSEHPACQIASEALHD